MISAILSLFFFCSHASDHTFSSREGPSFSVDWTSDHLVLWKKVLSPFRQLPSIQILEIGCFEGRSSIWFLENILNGKQGAITCIDPLKGAGLERFLANTKSFRMQNRLIFHNDTSQNVLMRLPQSYYDIIYVDGSHHVRDALFDMLVSHRLLKAGGMAILDDYDLPTKIPRNLRPYPAIQMYLESHGDELELIHKGYWQVIVKKRPGLPGQCANCSRVANNFIYDWPTNSLKTASGEKVSTDPRFSQLIFFRETIPEPVNWLELISTKDDYFKGLEKIIKTP